MIDTEVTLKYNDCKGYKGTYSLIPANTASLATKRLSEFDPDWKQKKKKIPMCAKYCFLKLV